MTTSTNSSATLSTAATAHHRTTQSVVPHRWLHSQ